MTLTVDQMRAEVELAEYQFDYNAILPLLYFFYKGGVKQISGFAYFPLAGHVNEMSLEKCSIPYTDSMHVNVVWNGEENSGFIRYGSVDRGEMLMALAKKIHEAIRSIPR